MLQRTMDMNIESKSPRSFLRGIGYYLLEQSSVFDQDCRNSNEPEREADVSRSSVKDTESQTDDEEEEGTTNNTVHVCVKQCSLRSQTISRIFHTL